MSLSFIDKETVFQGGPLGGSTTLPEHSLDGRCVQGAYQSTVSSSNGASQRDQCEEKEEKHKEKKKTSCSASGGGFLN